MMCSQKEELQSTGFIQNTLGLYCHIPFCASTCDFCAFYQEKPRRKDLDRYLESMDREFELLPEDRVIDTVFWGGGTPGLLAAKDLESLGQSMLKQLNKVPVEWTIEMAPSTVKVDKIAVLRDLGVTRISMGVQSFDATLLESLGRLHRPNQIYTAWQRIQEAGFANTNLDLMFALPNQSIEQWEAAIREAVCLNPSHISTYCLTFEEDTALYAKLAKGQIRIDEERELLFYERGWELLTDLGYLQYEISNFAKKGAECLHNLNTWDMTEWIGCGPSAASQFAGERYRRPASLDLWATSMMSNQPLKVEQIQLDSGMLTIDAVVFGLRKNAGIDLAAIVKRFQTSDLISGLDPLLDRFADEGLLIRKGSRIFLTHRGRLLCDAIGTMILEYADT